MPDFSTWLPYINTVSYVLLTASIAYLAFRQWTVAESQKQLTAAQQRARVRVEYIRVLSHEDLNYRLDVPNNIQQQQAARLQLELSNFGKGPADDLRITMVVSDDHRKQTRIIPLSHGGNLEAAVLNDHGGILGAEEKETGFAAGLFFERDTLFKEWISNKSELHRFLTPTELMWELEDSGYDEIRFQMKMEYIDGTGVRDPIDLLDVQIDLREHRDFRQAIELGDWNLSPS